MNIAITGATGFIGNELVLKHVECGNFVKILTRKDKSQLGFPPCVRIYNSDLSNKSNSLIDFVQDVDILFHCAAEISDETKMYDVNVIGTENLVNAAAGHIKHWVQLSSTGVYGNPRKGIITEDSPTDPKNLYEVTKLQSDEIVIKAGKENKFTYTILRPSNIFGAGMRNQSLFQLIKIIDNGSFFFIGRKGSSANYIPVENVVVALIICGQMQNAIGKTYILSDWQTMESFIGAISNSLNKPFPKLRFPRFLMKWLAFVGRLVPKFPLTSSRVDAFTNRHIYSTDLIRKELDYKQKVSMEEGLESLVLHYKKNSGNVH